MCITTYALAIVIVVLIAAKHPAANGAPPPLSPAIKARLSLGMKRA